MLEDQQRPARDRRAQRPLTRRLTRWLATTALAGLVVGIGVVAPTDAAQVANTTANAMAGTARARAFVPVAGPVFGDPTAPRNDIMTRLLDNIANTPAGATIQIVGYSFSLNTVATALLDAHARGVNVQVVMNGHSRVWSPAKRMVPVLGTDVAQPSFFVLTRGSARGTGGVTHQKSWTFSQVGDTPYVVMVGSTNLTGYGTEVQYSDNYVFTNRPDVYGVYAAMFAEQKLDVPVVDPFRAVPFDHGNVYFFPRPGTDATTDPTALRIRALPANPSTTVRVSQFAWYGPRGVWLADALADLKRGGATVSVVAGESVGGNVRSVLTSVGIPIYSGMYPQGKRIHTKLMLASWWAGGRSHRSICTGSDNWADESFRTDDDSLEVDDDVAGYHSYVRFFNRLAYPAGGGAAPPVVTPGVQRNTSVSIRLSHVRAHRYHRIVVTGTVLADYVGRRVLLQRHRYGVPQWNTAVTSGPLRQSTYRLRVPTRDLGSWRYRILVRATKDAKTGRSRVVALRVIH
jgi:hypothetical protein